MMDSSDEDTENFDEESEESESEESKYEESQSEESQYQESKSLQSGIEYEHEMPYSFVYTTKLDDMDIFNENTAEMRVGTIINTIIKESKPKLNSKRKWPEANHSDYSCYIKTFNRKVARIAKHNNHLLSMCKPVRVVLEDIKYILQPQSEAKEDSKINDPIPTKNKSRKLQVKMVYDQQQGEADMYVLDKYYHIQIYNKFRIDNIDDDNLHSLTVGRNVHKVSCCCWYNREMFLKSLSLPPKETVAFMRKPHKCAVHLCRCCCRSKAIEKSVVTTSTSPTLLKPSESLSVWVNKMPEKHVSPPISAKSKNTLFLKSLHVVPTLPEITDLHPVIEDDLPFLHSINIDFGGEYYVIGVDGQIKLHLKNRKDEQELPSLLPETANHIVGNICCWYKREEFASRLLEMRALPNTVNYIRGIHPCSATFCKCCCMPINTDKIKITLLPKAARHTNNMVRKKVNIKVRFADVEEKPINNLTSINTKPAAVKNTNDTVSFYVSLSSFEMMSKGTRESFPLLGRDVDPKRFVRVLIEKSSEQNKNNIKIECTQSLDNFTTKELRMLDMIFNAVKNASDTLSLKHSSSQQTSKLRQTKPYEDQSKREELTGCIRHKTIYPLILNKQLSIALDKRNKLFLQPLKAHLDKHDVCITDSLSSWLGSDQL